MTKLTFDVDFNKDPEEILKEIQERAKAEVAKRESKIKYASFLSKLHEKVNEEIGTEFKSINDLIRALTQFANPKLKEKISSSETGRRVTISMTGELFQEIKSRLSLPNPNKAAIARETGASVVQVRKVASGGYDQKFAEDKSTKSSISSSSESASLPKAVLPVPSLPSPTTEAKDPEPTLDEIPEKVVSQPEEKIDLNSLAEPTLTEIPTPLESSDDEPPLAPPPAPSLDLPPVPQSPELPSPPQPELSAPAAPTLDDLPPIAPPSFGEEMTDVPTPLAPPPAPGPVDAPPSPPSGMPQPSTSSPEGGPVKPSLSLKPKSGPGGKPGKPTLSLKTGKKKPMGLKITRPPMRPPSA